MKNENETKMKNTPVPTLMVWNNSIRDAGRRGDGGKYRQLQ
jgi:hypothetical protein